MMFNKIYEKIKIFMKENYKSLIVLLAIYLIFTIRLPFSIYTPGGAVNLNNRVEINDEYESSGSFNMAYVSSVRGSLPFILISRVIPDWDLVKASDITYKGEDFDELLKREKIYLEESIDNATINAYKYANKEININKVIPKIVNITEEAKSNLKIGDEIISINNIEVNTLEDIQNIISDLNESEKVSIRVLRDDKELDLYATTYKADDSLKIGIRVLTLYEYTANPKVNIKTKSSEAGSSGGLMMSLTIYNKLIEEDITKGKKIVGTGTIDIYGNIGEIGGVKYKLIGAVKNKAEVFICPKSNYEEAKKIAEERNYDIKIISASNFSEVLNELEKL